MDEVHKIKLAYDLTSVYEINLKNEMNLVYCMIEMILVYDKHLVYEMIFVDEFIK
jgi:hypothetical protein